MADIGSDSDPGDSGPGDSDPSGSGSEGRSGSSSDRFCTGCGRGAADCPGCARPLDPPRFCPRCGRRMAVRVTPGGFQARCRQHGVLPPG